MSSPLHAPILETVLCLDDVAAVLADEGAVVGIRKAQICLATTYMEHGNLDLAKTELIGRLYLPTSLK
eukprot:2671192-Pyramimonas_sp.AAC.1